MGNDHLVLALIVMTFIAVLAYGVWQLAKTRKAKTEHHHTAMTQGRPDLRD